MKFFKKRNRKRNNSKFHNILDKKVSFSYVEAYKDLRTNFDFVASVSEAKSILVTSALPDESKSTMAINLALALAESQHSVIVVECDLRKPVLRRYLKLERLSKDLTSLLVGNASLDECIARPKNWKINVIYAGMLPPNPSELLNQKMFEKMVAELKERYDYVILDAPPITVVTDAAVIGRVADGALLVIRSKYAQTKTIRLAKQRLEAVNIKILGAVITRFNTKKSSWKTGYGYSDYQYGDGENKG